MSSDRGHLCWSRDCGLCWSRGGVADLPNRPLDGRVWFGEPSCESRLLNCLGELLLGRREVVRAWVGGRASGGCHQELVRGGFLLWFRVVGSVDLKLLEKFSIHPPPQAHHASPLPQAYRRRPPRANTTVRHDTRHHQERVRKSCALSNVFAGLSSPKKSVDTCGSNMVVMGTASAAAKRMRRDAISHVRRNGRNCVA